MSSFISTAITLDIIQVKSKEKEGIEIVEKLLIEEIDEAIDNAGIDSMLPVNQENIVELQNIEHRESSIVLNKNRICS